MRLARPASAVTAVLLAAALAAPTAGAAVSSGRYKGETDQNRTVAFKVKAGKVVGFTAGVLTHCNTFGNNRFETDAVADVPAIRVKGNGRFAWKGDVERDGTITMAVKGRIAGGKAHGTVTLTRPDSHYDVSEGMTRFGTCGAWDRPWTARVR